MFKIRNFCMVVSLVLGFNLNFMHNAQATGVPQSVQVGANVQTTQNTQNEQNKQTLANTNSNENETQQLQISDEKLAEQFKNYMLWNIAEDNLKPQKGDVKNQADLSAYQQQAEQLWKKVDEFVKQSDAEGITPENFSDYIANFLKTKSKPMTTMSKADFENYIGSGEKIIRFYRGVKTKEMADSFRKGEIFIGGAVFDSKFSGVAKSSCGHGIYITPDKSLARIFTTSQLNFIQDDSLNFLWHGSLYKSSKCIIEMAIDESKIKMIEPDFVKQIAKAMIINHAKEFGVLDAFKNFCAFDFWNSYHSKLMFGAPFEKTFGVSFLEYVKKLAIQENLNLNTLNLQKIEDYEKFKKFCGQIQSFVCDCEGSNNMFEEFRKMFEQNPKKPHYINKYYICYNDEGLLAQLLGYDALVEFNKNRNEKRNFEIDECVVVNPGILTVCNQEDENLFEKQNESLDEIWNDVKKRFNN